MSGLPAARQLRSSAWAIRADDQTVGQRAAGRIHIALGQPHAALAVHAGEVRLTGCRRRQHHMGAGPIWVGTMSMFTTNKPPRLIASMMASTWPSRSPAGDADPWRSFTRSVRCL